MHIKQLERRITKGMGQAILDFGLIVPNDKILVAMSGGKDSYTLMWALQQFQKAAPFDFELVAYHLDQGQPGHNVRPLEEHMASLGVPYEVEYQDTYTRVLELTEPGKIYCSVCSRFRRAILYSAAKKHGCNKVALGHHRDDLLETLLLNLFFSGQLKAMSARLLSDDGVQEVIRPLCYVPEEEIAEFAQLQKFPILPCNLCGSQQAQRKFVKDLLTELSQKSPHLKGNMLHAISNLMPRHLLDKRYHPLFTASPEAQSGVDEVDSSCAPPAPSSSRLQIVSG